MAETDTNALPATRPTTSKLTFANIWDHILARWSVRRMEHRVKPGLYSLGSPTPDSPVLVTANYTLSFDALRSSMKGIDSYILVLDTQGVNVWCAAGKGTFGTDELVRRIEATRLHEVVNHRVLILPQLGAPGVAAHEVKQRAHFKVEYGPVRAEDLPEYLKTRKATPAMRRVRFTLRDRIALIPIELVAVLLLLLLLTVIGAYGPVAAILAGVVLFPILLPWIPTHDFSTKGFILGGIIAIPFAISAFLKLPDSELWLRSAWALMYALLLPPITAYLTLNFTGSTTFTSRSGVRREIARYIPAMAWMFGAGVLLNIALIFVR
ncbi:MAG TPA: mercury methylation corrinoid protein HgcA [Anaerolineales bacterium]|nr:mercury methylation corrinoid protein HgcA [Anaerolineales bacterium]